VLGRRVGVSVRGFVTFAPSASPRVLWLMNALNGADYERAAQQISGRNVRARYLTVRQLTAANNIFSDLVPVAGDLAPVEAGLDVLNGIWTVAGVRLARLTWVGGASSADMIGGLGYLKSKLVAGVHDIGLFCANPQFGARVVRNVIVAEALESLYLYNDLFGLPSTVAYWGSYDAEFMPPVGQDYVRFGALLAIDDRDTF
jgi:hypothetical protein